MGTIPSYTDATLPLAGTERAPLSVDGLGTVRDAAVDDIAARARLVNGLALVVFPERPDAAGTFFTTQATGDPLSVWFAPTISTLAGFGSVIQYTGGATVYSRGAVPLGPNRVYEIEAEVEQVSIGAGEDPRVKIGFHSLKSDYTATTGTPAAETGVYGAIGAGTVAVVRYRFGYAAPAGGSGWGDPSTAVLGRPYVRVNRKADDSGNATNSIARIRRFKVTDVTDLVATDANVATNTGDITSLKAGGEAVSTPAIAGGTLTLNLASNARNFKSTLNANITTLAFSNVPAGPNEFSISLSLIGNGSAFTVTWPASVKHAGGSAPTINTTNGKKNRFTLTTDDGGTTWHSYKAGET